MVNNVNINRIIFNPNWVLIFAAENWNEFAVFSYDVIGDNFISSEDYIRKISKHSIYAGCCELVVVA